MKDITDGGCIHTCVVVTYHPDLLTIHIKRAPARMEADARNEIVMELLACRFAARQCRLGL